MRHSERGGTTGTAQPAHAASDMRLFLASGLLMHYYGLVQSCASPKYFSHDSSPSHFCRHFRRAYFGAQQNDPAVALAQAGAAKLLAAKIAANGA